MADARRRKRNASQLATVDRTAPRAGASSAAGRSILWASNSPYCGTGYGTQTAQVVRRLAREGQQVALASNYGLEGAVSSWEGIKHFPRGFDMHSNDIIPAHYHAWAGETGGIDPLLFTLYDVWVFQGKQWDTVPRIASWLPIDHTPAPPKVLDWCRRDNVTPIAMSKFGSSMLERAGVEHHYVPHAIEPVFTETDTFCTGNEQITGRAFMDIPEDAYVIGMNSANKGVVPNRKAFPEAFLAASMVMRDHPDVWLYVHTEDRGSMGGINLQELARMVGIPMKRLRFVDQYSFRVGIPQELLAAIYTSMDVLLQPSMGEGFGIPAIEAQACGTPVVVSNFSAQPELVGDGWLVDGQPFFDAPQKAWLVTPSVESITDALEQAYARGRGRSSKAVEFASQYGADYVFDTYWLPTLAAL
jgi:glycosyltransferase involved in cell wall biosynthesis